MNGDENTDQEMTRLPLVKINEREKTIKQIKLAIKAM